MKAFTEFKETFQLKTVLFGNQPTFHHNNGSSQMDHILTNNLNVVSFFVLNNPKMNTILKLTMKSSDLAKLSGKKIRSMKN